MQTFPELRAAMARYGETQGTMGAVIGNTYNTFGKKLNNIQQFLFSDMWKLKKYFVEKGDKEITTDILFFNWKLTIVNKV